MEKYFRILYYHLPEGNKRENMIKSRSVHLTTWHKV